MQEICFRHKHSVKIRPAQYNNRVNHGPIGRLRLIKAARKATKRMRMGLIGSGVPSLRSEDENEGI
jgi:hypothetical protein